MSHVIVEVNTFTGSVSVPDDGDARDAASVDTAFQALANRTRNLKNRIDADELPVTALQRYAAVVASGTGIANGAKFSLAFSTSANGPAQNGGFTISGGTDLIFPAAGTYELHLRMLMKYGATVATSDVFSMQVVDTDITTSWIQAYASQFASELNDRLIGSAMQRLQVTDPSLNLYKLSIIPFLFGGVDVFDALEGAANCTLFVRGIL